MRFIHVDLPYSRVRLWPMGDWHVGSDQSAVGFVQEMIQTVRDHPEDRVVLLGDLIENAIIGSKSDVYLSVENPESQVARVINMLRPIQHQILAAIPGNHEQRTYRLVGLHPSALIATQLGNVPFCTYSCLLVLDLLKAHTPRSFSLYIHHGAGGGYTAGGKVNAAQKLRNVCPTVDAVITGHGHQTSRIPTTWYEAGTRKAIKKTGVSYMIGSSLTWDASYAEEKGARPSSLEQIAITFIGPAGGSSQRRQVYEIIEPGHRRERET